MSSQIHFARARENTVVLHFSTPGGRRRLEQHDPAAGRHVRRHARDRRVATPGSRMCCSTVTPSTRSKLLAEIELRKVRHQEAAALAEPSAPRGVGLGDHGGAQVDTRDLGAAAGQQPAPAADAAADVEHARPGAHAAATGASARRCSKWMARL